jgi:Bacterial PH domain
MFCTKCGNQFAEGQNFCGNCGTARNGGAPIQASRTEPSSPAGLVEVLPEKLEKILAENLQPGEHVQIKLKGANKEALVCTDRRVMILKTGAATGHLFGAGVFQLPYRNITGAQVNKHLISGYFEVSAGGSQNRNTTYMNAAQRENCVSIVSKDSFAKFRDAGAFILSRAS